MPGKIVHFELPAVDADRASGFWNGLFGWGLGASAMPDFDYRMAQVSDDQAVAVFPSEDKAGTGPIVYFETPDIEASIATARSLGGAADDKSPVPGHGWFAACTDTEGNAFCLWQPDETAAPPA
jgi:predicted enzyme related to lactoylglutathione lyase